jgi:hypothetical protein
MFAAKPGGTFKRNLSIPVFRGKTVPFNLSSHPPRPPSPRRKAVILEIRSNDRIRRDSFG